MEGQSYDDMPAQWSHLLMHGYVLWDEQWPTCAQFEVLHCGIF